MLPPATPSASERAVQWQIWGLRGSRLISQDSRPPPFPVLMGVLVWSWNNHSSFSASLSLSDTEFLATKTVDEWLLEEGSRTLFCLQLITYKRGDYNKSPLGYIWPVTCKREIWKPQRPVTNADLEVLVKRPLTMDTIVQQDCRTGKSP